MAAMIAIDMINRMNRKIYKLKERTDEKQMINVDYQISLLKKEIDTLINAVMTDDPLIGCRELIILDTLRESGIEIGGRENE